jgi:hypothetical protein
MNFLCEEKENTENEHCLPSQVAQMCTIWGNLNKLCHGFGRYFTKNQFEKVENKNNKKGPNQPT